MIQLDWKKKLLIVVVYTAVVGAFGSFLTPVKVTIQKEYVKDDTKTEVKLDKTQTDANKDRHIEKTVVEKVNKDGSKETTTKVVEDDSVKKSSNKDNSNTDVDHKLETAKETKIVEKSKMRTTISAIGGAQLGFSNGFSAVPVYGLQVQRDIFGPINLGVMGLSNGTAALSVGISF